jgi:hypothetical protein
MSRWSTRLPATPQVMIGLALVYRRTVKPALAASGAWAAAIWIAGEGFGSILTSTANPLTGALGAALLYTVAGLMRWPRQTDGEPVGRLAWATLWPASAALWSMPANDSAGSVPDAGHVSSVGHRLAYPGRRSRHARGRVDYVEEPRQACDASSGAQGGAILRTVFAVVSATAVASCSGGAVDVPAGRRATLVVHVVRCRRFRRPIWVPT